MQTTLISGPQGSGKNLLVRSLVNDINKTEWDFDSWRKMIPKNRFEFLNSIIKDEDLIIFDDIAPCKALIELIESCKIKNVNLVLISNVDIDEFSTFEIDRIFTVQMKQTK